MIFKLGLKKVSVCLECYKKNTVDGRLIKNTKLFLIVLQAKKSKVKIQRLVRTHFWFIDGRLLTITSLAGRNKEALCDLFYKSRAPLI